MAKRSFAIGTTSAPPAWATGASGYSGPNAMSASPRSTACEAVVSDAAVEEAAVIGVKHERWGEAPLAIVATGASVSERELIATVAS
jgi:acyl-CoA synthetase (AMP-forming)/AMP-acid ligase II